MPRGVGRQHAPLLDRAWPNRADPLGQQRTPRFKCKSCRQLAEKYARDLFGCPLQSHLLENWISSFLDNKFRVVTVQGNRPKRVKKFIVNFRPEIAPMVRAVLSVDIYCLAVPKGIGNGFFDTRYSESIGIHV